MLLVLLGYSGTGKSSISKILQSKYGLKSITTWTSREKRPGEVGGVDYNFCTNEEFDKLNSKGFFAETTTYCMSGGHKVQYGTPIEEIYGNKIVVLNPSGFKQLKKIKSLNVVSVLITTPQLELIKRLTDRGDSVEEYTRRLAADEKDFAGITDMVDYQVMNTAERNLEWYADLIWGLINE